MTLSGTHLLVELAPACASWGSGEHDYVGFWNLFRGREDCYGVATILWCFPGLPVRDIGLSTFYESEILAVHPCISIGAMAAFDELLLMSDLIVM